MRRVEIVLFAAARELANAESVPIEIPDNATAATVLQTLAIQHPSLQELLPACRLAVDLRFVPPDEPIAGAGQVALIPPVSGG